MGQYSFILRPAFKGMLSVNSQFVSATILSHTVCKSSVAADLRPRQKQSAVHTSIAAFRCVGQRICDRIIFRALGPDILIYFANRQIMAKIWTPKTFLVKS